MKNIENATEAPVCEGGCDYLMLHPHLGEEVKNSLPTPDELVRLAELFRMFGDGSRIKILSVLLCSEMCVCDIAQVVGMSVSAVSHQLRLLKAARLVKYRKEGKSAVYSLADDHVRTMIENGREHIIEK